MERGGLTVKKPMFTAEELAELAAFDAEVDGEAISDEDVAVSNEIERAAKIENMTAKEREAAEYRRRYREAHKDEAAEYRRRYYEAHKDEAAEYRRRYYEAHKDEAAERARRYYEAHKDEAAERARRYRERKKVQKNHVDGE